MEFRLPALEGLGLAAWWLDLADIMFDARERAYRMFLASGNQLGAARVAVWLAWDCWAFRGESAVANGWLQRARRRMLAAVLMMPNVDGLFALVPGFDRFTIFSALVASARNWSLFASVMLNSRKIPISTFFRPGASMIFRPAVPSKL